MYHLPLSHQVFFYQVHKIGTENFDRLISCKEASTDVSETTINSNHNNRAIVDGYNLTIDLYEKAKSYVNVAIENADLCLNILLLNFARYQSRAQYRLFIDECYNIDELDSFVKQLMQCSNFFIKLLKDLSIHKQYGLKAQSLNFINTSAISRNTFNYFFQLLKNKNLKVDMFIDFCKP